MTADFELKMGLLGKALDMLVMGRKFRASLVMLLAALGRYLDTGEETPRHWKPAA